MKKLNNVSLIAVDCLNPQRAAESMIFSMREIDFYQCLLLTSCPFYHPLIKTIKIPHLATVEDYSKFMICDLIDYIPDTHSLIIQWDGFVLNPDTWDNKFLEYDYIGAPWIFPGFHNVGNGGFSLRSHKFQQTAANIGNTFNTCHPEDRILCREHRLELECQGIKFADPETASYFSIEGPNPVEHPYFSPVLKKWNGQFGFHSFKLTDISASCFFNDILSSDKYPFIRDYIQSLCIQQYHDHCERGWFPSRYEYIQLAGNLR